MNSQSIQQLWALTPFGAEDDPADKKPEETKEPEKKEDSKTDDDSDDPYAGLSSKELKRLLKDAETQRDSTANEKKTLQDQIDEKERKERTEVENAKADLDKEKNSNNELRQALRRSQLENAILKDERFTWHNVDDVIAKLPESVKVDDKGVVSGLPGALGKVAKDAEYLVKSRAGQEDSKQQQNNNQQQQNGPTGIQPGQGGSNSGGAQAPSKTEMQKIYPALANR